MNLPSDLLSPWPKGLLASNSSINFASSPSTVVYMLPSEPAAISKSSSLIVNFAVLLLKISLLRSAGSYTLNVIFLAFSPIPPPSLISEFLYPQNSQTNAIIMISLKKGILEVHIWTLPSF